eukprot:Skav235131  [mRNA]  locus=scaffold321:161821:164873:+ [translate_table: standard]
MDQTFNHPICDSGPVQLGIRRASKGKLLIIHRSKIVGTSRQSSFLPTGHHGARNHQALEAHVCAQTLDAGQAQGALGTQAQCRTAQAARVLALDRSPAAAEKGVKQSISIKNH